MKSKEEIRAKLKHRIQLLEERRASLKERLAVLRDYQRQLATELQKTDWEIVEAQKELEFLEADWDDIQRATELSPTTET